MANTTPASTDSYKSLRDLIKTRWLNYRRKRFWAIVLVLLYTLLGFIAAPLIIKNSVVGLFRDDLGRVAQIAKVEVNPYVLSVKVLAFELSDKDDTRLAAFDEFYVNFQLSSLFNWAWTFNEIRLTGPYLFIERFQSGESRLHQLLADFSSSQADDADNDDSAEEADEAARLLIQNLILADGSVEVRDNVPATAVETRLAPIDIAIQELNTLPDRHGRQSVSIQLPNGASLQWSGSLTLAPLDSEGELLLDGLLLDPLVAYLKSVLPLESLHAGLSSRLQYRVHMDDSGGLDVEIDNMEVDLDDLVLTGLSPVTDFVSVPKISLRGGTFRYPEQSLQISGIKVDHPDIKAWVNENGDLSLLDLIPESGQDGDSVDGAAVSAAWKLGLDKFSLSAGKLSLSDRSVEPAAAIDITNLDVDISDISNLDNRQMPFNINGELAQGGSYTFDGKLTVIPGLEMSATASIEGIPLNLGQPYIHQYAHILIRNGLFTSDIEVSLSANQTIKLGGSVQIDDLEINDTLQDQSLLSWEQLDIDHFDLDDNGLHLSQVVFERAFGRIEIREDLSTNLTELLIEVPTDELPADNRMTDPLGVIIGGIRVNEGVLDFTDLSLPLPFASHIAHLNGSISTIDTRSAAPANIGLEGQVDEFGLARIDGSMNMLDPIRHTDVTVDFRNLKMSNLSPYTVQFAGREIDEGKLNLGLVYDIKEGQLHGSNDIVMSDLVLGDKVDHPDAVSLPLGLAVGLLKDADGVIKIDLPVEGDVNDPEFQIGGVVWQAISSMIAKLVTAPFRLLGKLIGIDSEDLGQFEFLAGRSDLTPPELEKIAQLQEALMQRPELVIEISGVTDRVVDVPALKFIKLRDIANMRLEQDLGEQDDQSMMLDVEIRAVVETMFTERFPSASLDDLKLQHMSPPAADPESTPILDDLAYAISLWNRLLDSEIISEQDLTELARSRAEVVNQAFLASGQFDQSRVVIAEPIEVESEDGEWVMLELSMVSD
jgi:hypothetical protein